VKLNIELDDDSIKEKIRQQMAAVINEEVSRRLSDMVEGILKTKMDRLTDAVLGDRIQRAADNILRGALGGPEYHQQRRLISIIEGEALKLLKEKMK
jgi:hypothetical protein